MSSNYSVPQGFEGKTNADAPLAFLLKYWGDESKITEYEAREWQKKFPEYANLIQYRQGYTDPDSGDQKPGQWQINNAAFEKMAAPEGSGFNSMYDYITHGRNRYSLPDPTNGEWRNYNMQGDPSWDPLLGWSAQSTNTGFDKFAPMLGASMMALMGGAGLATAIANGSVSLGTTLNTAITNLFGTGAPATLGNAGAASGVATAAQTFPYTAAAAPVGVSGTAAAGAGAGAGAAATAAGAGGAGGILEALGISMPTTVSGALGLGSKVLSGVGTATKIWDMIKGTSAGTTLSNLFGDGAANIVDSITSGGSNPAALTALLSAYGNYQAAKDWKDLYTSEHWNEKFNPFGSSRGTYEQMINDYYADPMSAIEKMPGYQFTMNSALNALDNKAGASRRFMGSAYPQWLQDRAGDVASKYSNQYENNLARLAGVDIGPQTLATVASSAMTNQQQMQSQFMNALAAAMGAGRNNTTVNVGQGGGQGTTTNSDGIRLNIGDPHAVTATPDFSFTENNGGQGVVDDFWGTPIGSWDVTGDPDYSFTDLDWG